MTKLIIAEITECINNIQDEKIKENLVKFIKKISLLSQDQNNHPQILDWTNDVNMNRYITNENIKYVRGFYQFLASMPSVAIKERIQKFIEIAMEER